MSEGWDTDGHSGPRDVFSPDFRGLEFPSDALSVKRLRSIFPQHFDGNDDRIADGYGNNDFFYPHKAGEPRHLVELTDMICDERVIADGAYKTCFVDRNPDLLNAEDHEAIDSSRRRLEENYLRFKLADSPETARLLIQHIEADAQGQARDRQQKHL